MAWNPRGCPSSSHCRGFQWLCKGGTLDRPYLQSHPDPLDSFVPLGERAHVAASKGVGLILGQWMKWMKHHPCVCTCFWFSPSWSSCGVTTWKPQSSMERKLRMEWDFWRPARCVKAADMQVAGCKVSGASIWYKACESKWLSWPIPRIPQLQVAFFWPDALCILLIHVGDSCGRVGCHLQEESGWIYVGFEYIWPLQTLVSRAKSDTMPVDPNPALFGTGPADGMTNGGRGFWVFERPDQNRNALKLPWHLSMVTCTLNDLSGEDLFDEEAAQVGPSVFSGSFARLLSFKNYCWDWFFGTWTWWPGLCKHWSRRMGTDARILAAPLALPKAEVLQKAKAVPLTPLPFEVTEEAPVARHNLRRAPFWPWNASNQAMIWHDSQPTLSGYIRICYDTLQRHRLEIGVWK